MTKMDQTSPCDHRLDATGTKRRVLVRDLNPHITCTLCEGYLIDATAINECLHTFCRSCIVRYLESSKYCPTCDILVHKNKPLSALKPDRIIQLLVYKLIPSVYQNEVKRRAEFYTNARASSSCSEDSILTDSHTETPEESIFSHIQSSISDFFSPDDSISLSLEYYNENAVESVDEGTRKSDINILLDGADVKFEQNNNNNDDGTKASDENSRTTQDKNENIVHKRYLQCPAGVNIKHLSKFIRMKYGLSFHHRVDIIYEEEILPKYFTLMDVAYTFKYKRSDPMRFMYRIFESPPPSRKLHPHQQQTPLTPSPDSSPKSDDTKDPCVGDPNGSTERDPPVDKTEPDQKETNEDEKRCEESEEPQQNDEFDDDDIREFAKKRDLEWANLIRQQREECDKRKKEEEDEEEEDGSCEEFERMEMSKLRSGGGMRRVEVRRTSNSSGNFEKNKSSAAESKKHEGNRKKSSFHDKDPSFYRKNSDKYEEGEPARRYSTDSEQKSRKGSSRHYGDAERIPKHLYKKSTKEDPVYFRRSESKKRKKSKHSRHADAPKRRRLHAEIQNQFEKEDILKLKVKLTPPSVQKIHKHRHADENAATGAQAVQNELSAKERLLQMRQVRHKNIQNVQQETKSVPTTDEPTSPERVECPVEPIKSIPDNSKKVRFDVTTTQPETDQRSSSPKQEAAVPNPPKKDPIPSKSVQEPVTQPTSPQRKCVPNLIAPNSFTVSKIVSGEKRKSESPDRFSDPKIPSLEITLINPTPQKQFPASNLVPNKNYQTPGTTFNKQVPPKCVNAVKPIPKVSNPIQKGAAPPTNLPVNPIKKQPVPGKPEQVKQVQRSMNPTGIGTPEPNRPPGSQLLNRTSNQVPPRPIAPHTINKTASPIQKPTSQTLKKTLGTNNAGKLNPSGPNKPPPATIPLSKIKKLAAGLGSASETNSKILKDPKASQRVDNFGALDLSDKSSRLTSPVDGEGKSDMETGKESKKDPQKSQNFSNLHILSESAVRIRDLMVSAQNKNMSGLFGPKLLAQLESHKNKLAQAQKEELEAQAAAQAKQSVVQAKQNTLQTKQNTLQKQNATPAPKIENKPIVVLSPKIQMQQMSKKEQSATNKTDPIKEVPKVSVSPVSATPTLVSPKLLNLIPNPRVPSPAGTQLKNSVKSVESTNPSPVSKVAPSPSPAAATSIKCVQQTNATTKPASGPKPLSVSGCPIPNLQMLKIPVLQNSKSLEAQMKSLQKMPKLQEISKMGHFGGVAQIRGTPNQAVRNIPNPSALMARQHQIQNRQNNGTTGATASSGDEPSVGTVKTVPTETVPTNGDVKPES